MIARDNRAIQSDESLEESLALSPTLPIIDSEPIPGIDEPEVAPQFSAEREAQNQLFRQYRSATDKATKDNIRNQIIEANLSSVDYVAFNFARSLPHHMDLDTIKSDGVLGLIGAIDNFDPDRGYSFKTYSVFRIRGAILDQLRERDDIPRLSRMAQSKLGKAEELLKCKNFGIPATDLQLAEYFDCEIEEVLALRDEARVAIATFSLSDRWEASPNDEDAMEKIEIIRDKGALEPFQEMQADELIEFVTKCLTHKERFIFKEYYQNGSSMREIGDQLELTESRVCQVFLRMEERIVENLRSRYQIGDAVAAQIYSLVRYGNRQVEKHNKKVDKVVAAALKSVDAIDADDMVPLEGITHNDNALESSSLPLTIRLTAPDEIEQPKKKFTSPLSSLPKQTTTPATNGSPPTPPPSGIGKSKVHFDWID